jgi:hypothetical protein
MLDRADDDGQIILDADHAGVELQAPQSGLPH